MSYQIDTLFSQSQIQQRVDELAAELAPKLRDDLVVIGLLKGAYVFTADLLRALSRHNIQPTIEFMITSSYGKRTTSSGNVEVVLDCREALEGRQVLLLDDILDTGNTLAFVKQYLTEMKQAEEVITCVLLDKPERRIAEVTADHVGFAIPDQFVVGYGLDYAHRHRELPYVGIVTPDEKA